MNIHFDIETIPGQRPGIREELAAAITHPANMSKADTIAKWEAEDKPKLVDVAYARAGLSGATGEVWCIAWAVDNEPVECASRDSLASGEIEVLRAFYTQINAIAKNFRERPRFIGHYISGFDLRFLWQRSVALGIRPAGCIPFDAKPWGDELFDTMVKWSGTRDKISQDNLCRVLGLPVKDGVDGSMIWDMVRRGEYTNVAEYCKGDVQRVREIYKRMQFQ